MKLILNVLVISIIVSISAKAQLNYPKFNYTDSTYKAGANLTKFLLNYYYSNDTIFNNYAGCNYHLVKFKLTRSGEMSAIEFDSDTSVATRFITNALKASAKRWDFTGLPKENSWNFILPCYFLFPETGVTGSIKIPFKTYYPEWPGYKKHTLKDSNGYAYQEVRGDTVVLWPIDFMGIIEGKRPGPRPVNLQIERKK